MKKKYFAILLIAILLFITVNCNSKAATLSNSQIEGAITWAYEREGDTSYSGWCLKFVANAWYSQGIGNSGYEYATLAGDAMITNTDSNPPRGATVFWDWYGTIDGVYRNWGHVGISLGDGTVIHADYNGVRVTDLDIDNSRIYRGWGGWAGNQIDYNTTPSSTPAVDTSTGKAIISWSDEYSAGKYNVRIKDSNGVSYDIWNVIEKNVQIVLPVGQYAVYIDYIKGNEYTKGTSTEFNVSSVYNGPTTSELYADTSGNSVNFTWSKSINAQGYNIRIVDTNGVDYSLWNQTETYASVVLPLGTYYAYVDSYKGDEVTKGKKICFTVTQSYLDIEAVTPSVSVSNSTVRLMWKKAKNATKYSVRIKKSDGTAYDIWSITDTTADIVLPKGEYSVYIDSVNDYGFKGGATENFVVAETIITLKTTVLKQENTHTINVGLYNINTLCNILVAGYKNNRLVTVENRIYLKENETFTATGDIDEIKVMLWESLSTMRPLCKAEVISEDKFVVQ